MVIMDYFEMQKKKKRTLSLTAFKKHFKATSLVKSNNFIALLDLWFRL